MSNLPLDTNVQFITIMATDMPCIGRGLGNAGATLFLADKLWLAGSQGCAGVGVFGARIRSAPGHEEP